MTPPALHFCGFIQERWGGQCAAFHVLERLASDCVSTQTGQQGMHCNGYGFILSIGGEGCYQHPGQISRRNSETSHASIRYQRQWRRSWTNINIVKGSSKKSSSAQADQRDPLQQQEWMGPKATPGPIFRGALKVQAPIFPVSSHASRRAKELDHSRQIESSAHPDRRPLGPRDPALPDTALSSIPWPAPPQASASP